MFKEIDLSKAVPQNTVSIKFRYRLTGRSEKDRPLAWLADNARGENPILLNGESGEITVRLKTPQKLYYSLNDPKLRLSLWIVEYRALQKHSC